MVLPIFFFNSKNLFSSKQLVIGKSKDHKLIPYPQYLEDNIDHNRSRYVNHKEGDTEGEG